MPIKKKQQLRLQHTATRKWLHSHQFQSPLSGNQEVSAFGGDSQSDGGDVWVIEWDGKAKFWKQDSKVGWAAAGSACVGGGGNEWAGKAKFWKQGGVRSWWVC